MKKSALFLIILVAIVMLLSVIQVVASNRLSTTGIELGAYQDSIKKYKTENAVLMEKLLIASSLNQIASSAAQLGFTEGKSYVFLSTPIPLAVNR